MNSVVYEIVFEDGVSAARRDQVIDAIAAMPGVTRMIPSRIMREAALARFVDHAVRIDQETRVQSLRERGEVG